mgnify:CR=1 FL=1
MHVLTKIFVVLVSLLAVLLVPLVVVYAHNEDSYQAKFQAEQARSVAASNRLSAAEATFSATQAQQDTRIQELVSENSELQRQADERGTEVRRLESRLAESESMNAEINSKLSTLASAVDAGQQLTESLIAELRTLRDEALRAERERVQLDEALRDALAQLDVAVEARRALEEELQRVKEEHAADQRDLSQYIARYGDLPTGVAAGAMDGVMPTKNLDATVIAVRRNADQVLAEIDAGSRDGVERGWMMTVGGPDGFVAQLRIIEVDINRATGMVELEDETTRGRVEVGHRAYARAHRGG